ncbi:MAG: hypothetical protein JWP89_589 [Schlesneria sp.]|nr:hypothetical protein [Schlesneria sp.]
MKLFISWSGTRSKVVAEFLSDWIKCVLQATRPWISTRDIDRGALWFSEISDQLKDTVVGIVCLTEENKNRPWILFETGALAKGLSSSRVCTFLIDLQPKDLEDPLAQFNHTLPTKESIWALIRTLNNILGSNALDERVLSTVFETYWTQFEQKFKKLLDETPASVKGPPRPSEDILADILENTRFISGRVRRLESSVGIPAAPVEMSMSEPLPARVEFNGHVTQFADTRAAGAYNHLIQSYSGKSFSRITPVIAELKSLFGIDDLTARDLISLYQRTCPK